MNRPIGRGALAALVRIALAGAVLAACSSPSPAQSVPVGSVPPDAPAPTGDPLGLGDIDWVFSPPADGSGPAGSYSLQAGTLADEEPIVDLAVPWRADLGDGVAREPAVGAPHGGSVVYVADDGAQTEVRRVEIAVDGADEALATLDEVVWDIVVAPDGNAAYAAIVDRADTERDLGVVRILLDGSGTVEPLLPPAFPAGAAAVRRLAIIAFQVHLAMTSDGQHLVRRTCAEGGTCMVEVAALATGRVVELPDREVLGGAAGLIVTRYCDIRGCRLETIDVASGATASADADVSGPVVDLDGQPIVVAMVSDARENITVEAVDPASGRRRVLYRVPENSVVATGDYLFPAMDLPDGFVHLIETTPIGEEGAAFRVDEQHLLISVADGRVIEIPRPPYRAPWSGAQG